MTGPRRILIDVPKRLVGQRAILRRWPDDDAPRLFDLADESRDHDTW